MVDLLVAKKAEMKVEMTAQELVVLMVGPSVASMAGQTAPKWVARSAFVMADLLAHQMADLKAVSRVVLSVAL